MKNAFLAVVVLTFAHHASAETWECTDSTDGHKYIVSQAVPVDICKLLDSFKSPHAPDAQEYRPRVRATQTSDSCNKDAAQDVQLGIREFAKWRVEGDHLAVHWVYKIEKEPEAKRLQMMTAYADMDACLSGGARQIMFYRQDKLIGIASPTSGVRLVK